MYDIVIIGSGPAGLSAAVYAKRAELKAVVIEKEYLGTGQIAESGRVDNYLGFYGMNGFELGEKFRAHAVSLGTEFHEGEVTAVLPENGFYRVSTDSGQSLETKTIIYASGASPKKLNIKGEKEYTGSGVSYCAICDGAFYKDKTVAVIGGGDTALEDALLLSKTAKTVYLIHRREQFRANKLLQNAIHQKDNIQLVLSAVPYEISQSKTAKVIKMIQNHHEESLEINGIFIAVGTVPNSSLLKGITELDGSGYVIAGEDCVTSAKGIFAAGDVRTKTLRQVVTAVADGANSVISAERYINRNKQVKE